MRAGQYNIGVYFRFKGKSAPRRIRLLSATILTSAPRRYQIVVSNEKEFAARNAASRAVEI